MDNLIFLQEYSPELQSISKRGKGSVNTGDGGIIVTGIRHVDSGTNGTYNPDNAGSYSRANSNPTAPANTQVSTSRQVSRSDSILYLNCVLSNHLAKLDFEKN